MQNFLSIRLLALRFIMGLVIILPAHADRLKDITEVAGVRGNQLVGYGLVVGPVSYTHLTLPTRLMV